MLFNVKTEMINPQFIDVKTNLTYICYQTDTLMFMRKFISIIVIIISSTVSVYAQTEQPQLIISQENEPMATFKEYEGFILDLNEAIANPLVIPEFKLLDKSTNHYIDWLDRLNINTNKTSFGSPIFSNSSNNHWNQHGVMFDGVNSPINSATFRLGNDWKLSTYGDYDANGYKRTNQAQLPWQKNDFRGGFEFKSPKGFSFRMEVRREGSPHGIW